MDDIVDRLHNAVKLHPTAISREDTSVAYPILEQSGALRRTHLMDADEPSSAAKPH